MDETTGDAVINELIEKAVSHIEPVALQLSDSLENLESREILAALGALSGCEEAIRSANLVLAITRDYQEKLNRARSAVADNRIQADKSGGEDRGKLQGRPTEHRDQQSKYFCRTLNSVRSPALTLLRRDTSSIVPHAKPITHSSRFPNTAKRLSVTTAICGFGWMKPPTHRNNTRLGLRHETEH